MADTATNRTYALDMDGAEWKKRLDEMGQPRFRAGQMLRWLWQKHVYDADGMTDLSKPLRDEMNKFFDFSLPLLVKEQRSADGTRKYLWQLRDGETVESVLMKHGDRLTACVSSQVGCPLQCLFCATGLTGYSRDLSAGEIAAQFLAMEKAVGRDIGNIVYMGMGEPFLNTENVLKSVRMLNDENMRNLGIRHISLSTSGVVPGILALAESGLKARLSVSLHAVDDELRGQLMPINQRYPVSELRVAMLEYQRLTGDRITIEYALFHGVNDGVEQARALVRYLRGVHVFVNLIPGNDVEGRFEKSPPEDVLRFRKVLETAGFESEIRQEHGADIDAACGQLRRKHSADRPYGLEDKPGFKPGGEMIAGQRHSERGETSAPAKRGGKIKEERGQGGYKRQDGGQGRQDDNRPVRGETKPRYAAKGAERAEGAAGRGKTSAPAKRGGKIKEERGQGGYKRQDGGQGRQDDNRPVRGETKPRYAAKGAERAEGATGRGKTAVPAKRRKTREAPKERYRGGKIKEERPSYKGRDPEKKTERAVARGADDKPRESGAAVGGQWYEGAVRTRRPKAKKAASPGAKKTSMTGAQRRPKSASKAKAKKK